MQSALYHWQEDCLKKWLSCGGRGIVEAVTGSGKTRLALEACKRLRPENGSSLRIKIVVPTAALMRQWSKALREDPELAENPLDIGLCGGGVKTQNEKNFMVYVVNSARYRLAREILQDFRRGENVLLIADECHHYASGENNLIFEFRSHMVQYETQYFALGLSATMPRDEAGKTLYEALGGRIYRYGIQRALRAQTICKYDIYHVEVPLSREERENYEDLTERMYGLYLKLLKLLPSLRYKNTGEIFEELTRLAGNKKLTGSREAASWLKFCYQRRTLVCTASARTSCAVQLISLMEREERIIVFGERISQTEELYERLQKICPGKIGRYHSRMGAQANKNTLERFRDGEIRILLTCRSLDEGMDVPEVTVGIVLSGTSVRRQRVQRLGRVIRRAEGKEQASLYYLHTEGTSEDSFYLPDESKNRTFELKYIPETEEFYNEEYEWAAEEAWHILGAEKRSPKAQQEILRCFREGSIRGDWKDCTEELKERAKTTCTVTSQNYWICMEKIQEAYKKSRVRD